MHDTPPFRIGIGGPSRTKKNCLAAVWRVRGGAATTLILRVRRREVLIHEPVLIPACVDSTRMG
jgi:hypothetical protein